MAKTIVAAFLAVLVAAGIASPAVASPDVLNEKAGAIINGVQSEPGRFPYYVRVARNCGGVLIAPDIVLTAAHCKEIEGKRMHVGAYKRNSTEFGAQFRKCERRIGHPSWDPATTQNDYALCKLNEPVIIDDSFVKLSLNEERDDAIPAVGTKLIAMGLGHIGRENKTIPNLLRNVTFGRESSEACEAFWEKQPDANRTYNRSVMLCVEYDPTTDRSTCYGDSGGPLVERKPYRGGGNDGAVFVDTLFGITSFGKENCTNGVFSRVGVAMDWIRSAACDTLNSTGGSSLCEPTDLPAPKGSKKTKKQPPRKSPKTTKAPKHK